MTSDWQPLSAVPQGKELSVTLPESATRCLCVVRGSGGMNCRSVLQELQRSAERVIGGANPGAFLPGQLRDWKRADAMARDTLASEEHGWHPLATAPQDGLGDD